jgi:hypothetical protein
MVKEGVESSDDGSLDATIKFHRQTVEMMHRLRESFGATSNADVIKKALALLEIARQAKERGGNMVIQDPEGIHKILGL